MANALQLRRGTTAQHSSFTGLAGEVTVDTDKDTVVVHDGTTAGGTPLAKEATLSSYATTASLANVATSGAYSDLSGTPSASDLLTSIKTVDGPASGLDADTLDGKQLATLESEYQSYADTAVSNLVASAPATLDTLNELAAALGDDPNFATTVTNSIATKMPLAGGTFTGNVSFGDDNKAIFGAGSDLQIYHDGAASHIVDNGTGDLRLQGVITVADNPASNDGRIIFGDAANAQGFVHYDYSLGDFLFENTWADPQADFVFRTNSVDALTISPAGVDITGTLTADGVTVDGTLDIEEVFEKVSTASSTSGTIAFDVLGQGVVYWTNNQTANRTINFIGDGSNTLNSVLAVGQSATVTALLTQGSTAYYLNAYQVDGSSVTPKWSGGSAPTGGNASGIDVYTFTIIKTANATFTVLASVTQYA